MSAKSASGSGSAGLGTTGLLGFALGLAAAGLVAVVDFVGADGFACAVVALPLRASLGATSSSATMRALTRGMFRFRYVSTSAFANFAICDSMRARSAFSHL